MAGKGKKMSPALKAFLAKYGRFPRKGELKTRKLKAAKSGGKKKMASKKGNGGPRRQGLVSWATSMIQLGTVLANPVARMIEASRYAEGQKVSKFTRAMVADYTGFGIAEDWSYVGWDPKRMVRGYAPPVAGYAFRKGTSYFMKGVHVQLIPKLR